MKIGMIVLCVSLLWIVSEIVLAILKRCQSKDPNNHDRFSQLLLWLTIISCVFAGIFVRIKGIGYIPLKSHALMLMGLVLIILGLAIRWIAIFTLRRYFTVNVAIVNDHKIIKSGLYKYIRHPSYTGTLLSFLGLGLAFSNWLSIAIIFIPILIAFLHRINIEERVLVQTFGDEYLNYVKSTKRLVPRVY